MSNLKEDLSVPVSTEKTADASEKRVIKFNLWALLCFLLVVFALVGFVTSGIVSFQKYSPSHGVVVSEFVGFSNYLRFFQSSNFQNILVNTLTIKLVSLVSSLLLGGILALCISMFRKQRTPLVLSALFLIPVCMPQATWFTFLYGLLPRELFIKAQQYSVVYALQTALVGVSFVALTGGVFSVLKKRGVGKGVFQGIGVAALVQMLFLLTVDLEAQQMSANAAVLASANTFDYHALRTGLHNMQYSVSSAVSTLKSVAQLLLSVVPAVLLARMATKDDRALAPALADRRPRLIAWSLAGFVWTSVLLGICLAGVPEHMRSSIDPESFMNGVSEQALSPDLLSLAARSAVYAALSALFAAGAWTVLRRGTKNAGKSGMSLLMLTIALATAFNIGEYLLAHQLGMVNTVFAPSLRTLLSPVMLMLLITLFLLARMNAISKDGWASVAVACVAAAIGWGGLLGGYLYINDTSLMNLGLYMYRINMGASAAALNVEATEALTFEAIKAAVRLWATLPCLAFGGAAAFAATRALKD